MDENLALASCACIVAIVTVVRSILVQKGRSRIFAGGVTMAVPMAPAILYSAFIIWQLATTTDPSVGGAGILIPFALIVGMATGAIGIAISKAIIGKVSQQK